MGCQETRGLKNTWEAGLYQLHLCYRHEKNLLSPYSWEENESHREQNLPILVPPRLVIPKLIFKFVGLLLYASEIPWLFVTQQYCDHSYWYTNKNISWYNA